MALSVVLAFLPTIHPTMTSNDNTTNNNTISTPVACNGGPTATILGVYQQMLFGLSEILIETLVSNAISVEPYRKALITKIISCQILLLSDNPSVFFSDLMTTTSPDFGINTGSTERYVESA